ncbi:glycosyltransferase [Patescibacteria group bacterium]|nr:glycosyltransferase [Patescibacteria group bacterium]
MKIALVHDYLREYGGAERVVEALHELWPEAPLFTSFVDWQALGPHAGRFRGWDIRTSPVADNWLIKKFHSPLRFLAPKIWQSIDVSGFDVVLSSSGWFMCRGVALGNPKIKDKKSKIQLKYHNAGKGNQIHICYIHHPPRNLYGYATGSTLQKYWPVRVYAAVINFFLRHYDFETAQHVDYFIANSKETARRVMKFYRRESTVIYPPIEINPKYQIPMTRQVQLSKSKIEGKEYCLSVGRLTYSKRVDLAIEAANRLNLPLKIVGTGSEEACLKSMAGPTVEFLGSVSDEELDSLYERAKALIFCALDEDFGMVPVEAMAHGVPVIGLAQGGVLETVLDGRTGVLFKEPTVMSLISAIKRLEKEMGRGEDGERGGWGEACRRQAAVFHEDRFKKDMQRFIGEKLSRFMSRT